MQIDTRQVHFLAAGHEHTVWPKSQNPCTHTAYLPVRERQKIKTYTKAQYIDVTIVGRNKERLGYWESWRKGFSGEQHSRDGSQKKRRQFAKELNSQVDEPLSSVGTRLKGDSGKRNRRYKHPEVEYAWCCLGRAKRPVKLDWRSSFRITAGGEWGRVWV